jgi:hypothetical protein
MPTPATISRIAKILARVTSTEGHEAEKALQSAYKSMVHDGITIEDVLTLPVEKLYQDTLMQLVTVVLANQDNLSHSSKRERYSKYALLIAQRFSGAWDGQGDPKAANASNKSTSSTNHTDSGREEQAREYEARRQAQEKERGRAESHTRQTPPPRQEQSQPSSKSSGKVYPFSIGKYQFTFSPVKFWAGIAPMFARGSLLYHTLHNPVRAGKLFAASLLWGMGFAMVLILVASVIHAITSTKPLYDVSIRGLFTLLSAIGTVWKSRLLMKAGWFDWR